MAYYMLVRRLIEPFEKQRPHSIDPKVLPAYDFIQACLLHLLDTQWQVLAQYCSSVSVPRGQLLGGGEGGGRSTLRPPGWTTMGNCGVFSTLGLPGWTAMGNCGVFSTLGPPGWTAMGNCGVFSTLGPPSWTWGTVGVTVLLDRLGGPPWGTVGVTVLLDHLRGHGELWGHSTLGPPGWSWEVWGSQYSWTVFMDMGSVGVTVLLDRLRGHRECEGHSTLGPPSWTWEVWGLQYSWTTFVDMGSVGVTVLLDCLGGVVAKCPPQEQQSWVQTLLSPWDFFGVISTVKEIR